MSYSEAEAHDPDTLNDPYYFVWCSPDGTNDGTINDTGELQGRTIVSYTLTIKRVEYVADPVNALWQSPDPNRTVTTSVYSYSTTDLITIAGDNTNAVNINGVAYGINTVVTIPVSGGTHGYDYSVLCRIVPSGGGTPLDKTMIIPVRNT